VDYTIIGILPASASGKARRRDEGHRPLQERWDNGRLARCGLGPWTTDVSPVAGGTEMAVVATGKMPVVPGDVAPGNAMRCPVIELLTDIRDRLRNLDMLEEKRTVKAAQQVRYRARRKTGGPRSSAAASGVSDGAANGVVCAVALERNPPCNHPVDTTLRVDTTKEDEKGKETLPPAPYRE